jgi:hypothetical protein
MAETVTPTDEALLDEVQRAAFDYFLQTVNPANGLVADTSRENSPVCTENSIPRRRTQRTA